MEAAVSFKLAVIIYDDQEQSGAWGRPSLRYHLPEPADLPFHHRSSRKRPPNPASVRCTLTAASAASTAPREALPCRQPLFCSLFGADVSLAGLDNAVLVVVIIIF